MAVACCSGPARSSPCAPRALTRTEAIAQRRAFLASLLGPGWFAGISEIPLALHRRQRPLGLGLDPVDRPRTFYVGPSLISLYDSVGNWLTLAMVSAAAAATLLLLERHVRRKRFASGHG